MGIEKRTFNVRCEGDDNLTAEEKKQYKAKQLRYKKPIASHMNYQFLVDELYEMQDVIQDVQWFCEDEDNLVNALDGDDDEAYEFKMAFSDLAAELERFEDDLHNEYVPDCFDDLFPAVRYNDSFAGWDSYEQDYFGLMPFEYGMASKEAEKRILRLTKKELLEAVGVCLRVYSSYMALRYRYDCLKASLDILREQNMELIKLFKAIEAQYNKAESESQHFEYKYHKSVYELDRMLDQVPQEFWIQ